MKRFINKRGETINISYRILVNSLLLIVALGMIIPFWYMLFFSLRVGYSEFNLNFSLSDLTLINYISIFKNYNFFGYFMNSTIVVISTCGLNIIICSMAGYAFAKKNFYGRDKIFFALLITLMIPSQVKMIPVYTIMKNLGWINTYQGLIFPLITAFGVFVMRQFMVTIPDDLIDAAKIDGCSEVRLFVSIVLPIAKPPIIALIIFTFISAWNSFLWPLVITTTDSMRTITLGLSILQGKAITNYGLVMAGATLTFLPPFTLYLILQRRFVQGVTLSGMKA